MDGAAGYWYVGGVIVAGLLLGVSLSVTVRRTRGAAASGMTAVPPQARHAAGAPVARTPPTLAAPAWSPASTDAAAWLPEPVRPPTWRPAD
jgi:hypothetical protein